MLVWSLPQMSKILSAALVNGQVRIESSLPLLHIDECWKFPAIKGRLATRKERQERGIK